jgi:hypothetical protein
MRYGIFLTREQLEALARVLSDAEHLWDLPSVDLDVLAEDDELRSQIACQLGLAPVNGTGVGA